MRRGLLVIGLGIAVATSACVTPDADVSTTTTVPAPSSSTLPPPPATTTTAPTTTTTTDPTETFLAEVPAGPSLIAITEDGHRTWAQADGVWEAAGPMVRFEVPPEDGSVPIAYGGEWGVVYQAGDGSIRFSDGSGEDLVSEAGLVLHDVVTDGEGEPVAVVGPEGIVGVDVRTGETDPIFEARVPQDSASYGDGQVLLLRGEGPDAVASLATRRGQSIRLDLLATGNPVSAVLSPDGTHIVFSTDDGDVATFYTLAVGSQGPAAAHPLGIDGQVERLDTDGTWVAGAVDAVPFLYDLEDGEVFFGPDGVRFTFDRNDRRLADATADVVQEGRFFGYIRSAREGSVRFDDADFLTGEEAAVAAEAAGDESPPPNDFYIRNPSEETRRVPLAQDVEIRVQASYPEAGVDWEAIAVDQWLRLLEGDDSAVDFEWYGQGTLPYWITVEDGSAILVEEFYLP